jgi:signal peptidase I
MIGHQDAAAAATQAPEKPPSEAQPEPTPNITGATQQEPQQPSIFGLQTLLSSLVMVLFVITFVVQAFRVPSASMENTLLVGDFLLADKMQLAAGGIWSRFLPYRAVQRGDIIVFHYPVDPATYFVKRVIGVPGDRIRLRNKVVYVNGAPLQESYVVHKLGDQLFYRDNFPTQQHVTGSVNDRWLEEFPRYVTGAELTVPAGSYFVMGDNRDSSLDSRFWGFVPRANIMARPLVIYLSIRGMEGGEDRSNDKLYPSGQTSAHSLQLARWDRTFRLIR